MNDFSISISPSLHSSERDSLHHLRSSVSLNQFGLSTPALPQLQSPLPPQSHRDSPQLQPQQSQPQATSRRRTGTSRRRQSSSASYVLNLANKALSILWVPTTPFPAGVASPEETSNKRDDDDETSDSTYQHHLSLTGYILVVLLFLLGLKELYSISTSSSHHPALLPTPSLQNSVQYLNSISPPSQQQPPPPQSDIVKVKSDWDKPDTTAIVLHWKRTENVGVVLAHLCKFSFFKEVVVWNNNPDIHLTRETFASSLCPAAKLRIHNSPSNLLFLSRYLACSHASTRNCYVQDDDWINFGLKSLYSQFQRDENGPLVVGTTGEMRVMSEGEWCFFQMPILHTCFTWLGTGSFISRSHVHQFLKTISTLSSPAFTREELSHADNSFSIFLNEPSYLITLPKDSLIELPLPKGRKESWSDGESGKGRNRRLIQQALHHLLPHLEKLSALPDSFNRNLDIPVEPNWHLMKSSNVTRKFKETNPPPFLPNPAVRHSKSACYDDSCLFITNLPLLPSPSLLTYPGPTKIALEDWENLQGYYGRGWIGEGGDIGFYGKIEEWIRKWGAEGAVDGIWGGKGGGVFRGGDVIKEGDYVGLGLLNTLDPRWVPKVNFHFILEGVKDILRFLVVEVSDDGYRWVEPSATTSNDLACSQTPYYSTNPSPSVPFSPLLSPEGLTLYNKDLKKQNNWWKRKSGDRLIECWVELSSETGWRFVRIKARDNLEHVWGVYGIWID